MRVEDQQPERQRVTRRALALLPLAIVAGCERMREPPADRPAWRRPEPLDPNAPRIPAPVDLFRA